MVSPEKFTPLEPEKPEKRLESRIEARPAGGVLSGKQELIPYIEPEEFESLIAMPVYEEFDAARSFVDLKEEIAAMKEKKLPPEERRGKSLARVGEIRERLAWQEQGIAEAIRTLWGVVEKNPNENDRELFRRVAELAPKYHFSGDQLREFWNAILKYRMKHARVERVRNEYPDDAGLFEACFGGKPRGKVEVEKGPMSLYFHCYDDGDYVAAYAFDETGGDEKKLTNAMKKRAFETGGAALSEVKIKELAGAVAIERTSIVSDRAGMFSRRRTLDKPGSDAVRAHEEQHLINRLFRPIAERVREEEIMARVARTAETVDEGRRILMRELARSARAAMGIDEEARDEVLAHYRDGATPEIILGNLTTLSLYDYKNSARYKEGIAGLPKVIAGKMMGEMSAIFYTIEAQGKEKIQAAGPLATHYSEVEPYVEKAFGEDYEKDLARWVGAIEALEKKGYGRDEIVSMLYGDRVSDWTAFARRAQEKKKEGA